MTDFCVICDTRISESGGAWVDASGNYGRVATEPHFHRPAGVLMENLAEADITSCGARVARCVCIKPMGHVKDGDDIHACDPTICGGSWRGEEPNFYPVTFPSPGGPRS